MRPSAGLSWSHQGAVMSVASAGDDDAVVGAVFLVAQCAVAGDDLDLVVAGAAEVRGGLSGEAGIVLDGDDLPAGAG